MSEEETKKTRECGYCHQAAGHNARSCPKKKEDESNGTIVASASPKKGMPKKKAASKKRSVDNVPTHALSGPSATPIASGSPEDVADFEEISKYAHVGGKTLACKLREYAGGHTQVAMMVTEGEETKAFPLLDVDVASRLLELLGGIIQRHASRPQSPKGPVARVNTTNPSLRALANGTSTKSSSAHAES